MRKSSTSSQSFRPQLEQLDARNLPTIAEYSGLQIVASGTVLNRSDGQEVLLEQWGTFEPIEQSLSAAISSGPSFATANTAASLQWRGADSGQLRLDHADWAAGGSQGTNDLAANAIAHWVYDFQAEADGKLIINYSTFGTGTPPSGGFVDLIDVSQGGGDPPVDQNTTGVFEFDLIDHHRYRLLIRYGGGGGYTSDNFAGTASATFDWEITGQQADIAMQSAQLQPGNTVRFTYETTGTPGHFQAGLYASMDATYDPADVLITTQTVTPSPTNPQALGTFNLPNSWTPDPTRPYLLAVADPTDQVQETDEGNNTIAVSATIQIRTARLYDIDSVQIGPNLPLRYLSVSSANPYFGGNTRVNGTIRVEGLPQDSLRTLELEIIQGGVKRATANLVSGAQGLLRQFGPSGVIELQPNRLLFELPNSQAAGIDVSQDDTLTLRVVASSAFGGTSSFAVGQVEILTRYTGVNRYGPRNRGQGGDDWVLPSIKRQMEQFGGVQWGDMSNMNGGPFSPHASHRRGIDADFKLDGFGPGESMINQQGARKLAAVLNSLSLDTLSRIDVLGIDSDARFRSRLLDLLSADRKDFINKLRRWDGHDTHFHIRFIA